MSRLKWDEDGKKFFETGVEKAVLYTQASDGTYNTGVAWNGLTAVNESPSGGEATTLYANDDKYLDLISTETYGATIEAYTCPDEFMECDGSKELEAGLGLYAGQQTRKGFGFTFTNIVGNDTDGTDHGYIITIVYGCKAQPSSRSHSTINESPEAQTLSWEVKATPIEIPSTIGSGKFKKTATLKIDSRKFTTETQKGYLAALEGILYGTDGSTDPLVQPTVARLPMPAEVYSILKTGTYSAG